MRAGCLLRSNVWHAPPRRTPTVCRLFLGCRCPCRCLLRLALCCHEIWNKQMHGAEKVAKRKQKKARKPKEKQKQRRKTRIWNMRKIKLLTKIIYVMVCSTHTHTACVRECARLSVWVGVRVSVLVCHVVYYADFLAIFLWPGCYRNLCDTLNCGCALHFNQKGDENGERKKREKALHRLLMRWSWKLLGLFISYKIFL